MTENDQINEPRRTEEVQDIIDRMPHRTGKTVTILLCGLAALLVLFGWLIEYPETVSGSVSITASQAPVRLVAIVSGKIHLLKNNRDTLNENDIIAVMENPANMKEVMTVDHFINKMQLDSLIQNPGKIHPPKVTALGELSSAYFSFCDAFEKMRQYQAERPYEKKKAGLKSQLASQIKIFQCNREQIKIKSQTLKISKKNIHRDSLLFETSAIAELDLEKSAVNYLGLLESKQSMQINDASFQLQINDTQNKLQLLEIERSEKEQQLTIALITGFNNLRSDLLKWKQQYLFIAPFAGTLEYLNFWRENDFFSAGIEVFSVLPGNNQVLGQIYLPANGAGKVQKGQKVVIKLDNYPHLEYGSVEGLVHSVSSLTNQTELISSQEVIPTYMITVDLPNRLKTNYGSPLDFDYELRGTADIVTKPRKLFERFFDNLKYIAREK